MSMNKISDDVAVQRPYDEGIPTLTEVVERECLARLARDVPAGGKMVETGTLYGGTTAVLALANRSASLVSIDNFAGLPEGNPAGPISPELVYRNLEKLGVIDVTVMVGDSTEIGKMWVGPINLLLIDGGHEYVQAYSDLVLLGSMADVIAIHDYGNPYLDSVKRAVMDFVALGTHNVFEVVHWLAVLRRVP